MFSLSLSGTWQLSEFGSTDLLPATVPGCVHTDLLVLNRIPDPHLADNEKRVQWVAERDWVYQREFAAAPQLFQEERIFLVCDGLDTLATVYLNDRKLGQADNSFCQYQWEVTGLLQPGPNRIRVEFSSPLTYIRQRQAQRPLPAASGNLPGSVYLRKAACQFGWDWGPQLPSMGIWKEIRLEGRSAGKLNEVHIRQEHTHGQVRLSVSAQVENWAESGLSLQARLLDPAGRLVETQSAPAPHYHTLFDIVEPLLWWPNGYGEQPLYTLEVTLLHQGQPVDSATYAIGLRTVELLREPDEWGTSFQFVVNGVPLFAKGSNWIPPDSFPNRVTPKWVETLLQSAAASHQNMLRVWGGGFYPDEDFYSLCDRYGLLVWQDMMFACMVYPLNQPEFLQSVELEIRQNVRRARHHACLALWCGNNEIEEGWEYWGWDRPENADLKAAYRQFFHATLPTWMQQEDASRPYWPSSPFTAEPFTDTHSTAAGDAHYWEVWHGRKPFTAYREVYPRFMSEFGFQAFPPVDTIRHFAPPSEWNINSYLMDFHQRGNHGNTLIVSQMLDTFQLPSNFESLVYTSMVLQAEGIRNGIEHWRRNKHRVGGVIYWQLNDTWPGVSWSSLDYFGRWKALHYSVRRAYAPLLLSLVDSAGQVQIHVTSDQIQPWSGQVRWELAELDGCVLNAGGFSVQVPALQSVCAGAVEVHPLEGVQPPEGLERQVILIAELVEGEQNLARQVLPFVPNKHLDLKDPHIHAQLELRGQKLKIQLQSESLARFIELSISGTDVIFSDNYFDLPAGRSCAITCVLPDAFTLALARHSLKIKSLYDTYQH